MTDVGRNEAHMARALCLARRGLYSTDPNPRVGCVVVKNDEIVGEGWHERAGEPHAEVHALREAGERAHAASVFVTLEPCCHQGRTSPCTDLLVQAQVGCVVVAMEDPNPEVNGGGLAALKSAGLRVEVGLLREQAEALNPGFVSRMRRRRPFVRAKLAASLDGRTAMCSGESQWISGEAARADVQRWRARSSAILSGIGTVLADDPALTVRDLQVGRQPLRVVVDTHLRTPPTAKLLVQDGAVVIITASNDGERAQRLQQAGAEVVCLSGENGSVDLHELMRHLGVREVNEVLLESGATLCGSLLQAGLVDELLIYLAPTLMGDEARGMFRLPGLERLQDRIELEIKDVRAVGRDWRFIAKVRREA
ncbi:MAG: bifunctional diaminohydroxyphosphoribosylaminopyrimidine deaminase/5-amino-6-(5-phosphoribosylamino)uracil reductase RibD [Acidiferrobacterales bacterium]|nr:bifunctional diaminohydroxyphosphoribosylaminopyrimidine deaminase/5-amino-6-(5-phosphoribosylamino)uracil reductase RibD [Gammaproteobacteria bacterium]